MKLHAKLLRFWSCSLVVFVLFGCKDTSTPPANAPTPNIILINVDDIGYGDFGVYGQKLIKTPHIDQMAAQGIRFTDFYASAPVCGPSRASLLTGMHAGHLKACGNGQANLSENFTLWPQMLRDQGYTTAMIGKQHKAVLAGDTVLGDSPLDRGFESFTGWLNAVDAHQHFIDGKTPGWERRQYLFTTNDAGKFERLEIAPSRWVQNEFVDRALDFIERPHDKPFFLYLPWTIAHAELAVPRSGDPDYRPEDAGLLEQYLDADGKSIFPEFNYQGDEIYARPVPYMTRATLAAMISRLDRDIGKLLDLLESLDQNTLVILTSDNGPHDEAGVDSIQIDGILDSPFNSSGGLKGFKRSLHEGGVRVPMIAWWPGKVAPNQEINTPYTNYDIGPTILDLVQKTPMDGVDGISFADILQGKQSAETHPHLYFQFGKQQSLRMGNWKLYRGQNQSGDDPVELYDLSVDAEEQNDLAGLAEHKDLIKEMQAIMNAENADSPCKYMPFAIEP
ncbi:MAG: sulfatase-like hydrolase/transferase [Bacteroidia bacterium]